MQYMHKYNNEARFVFKAYQGCDVSMWYVIWVFFPVFNPGNF